jgi:hypothetical protein
MGNIVRSAKKKIKSKKDIISNLKQNIMNKYRESHEAY